MALANTPMRIPLRQCGPAALLMAILAVAATTVRADDSETVLTASSVASGNGVEVTVDVDPKECSVSDFVTMRLAVRSRPGVQVEQEAFGDRWGDFRICDMREELPIAEDGWDERVYMFTLEPTRAGELTVWGVPVSYRDAQSGEGLQTIATDDITVRVGTVVEHPEAGLANLDAPIAPMRLPHPGPSPWLWVALAGIAVATAGMAAWRHRRKQEDAVRVLTAKEIALHELQDLIDSNIAANDVKVFYVEITGIVRRFIERTTGILAAEQTTEEFLREIADRVTFDTEEKLRLQRFLKSADLVKFAAHRPTGDDLHQSVDRAKAFIETEHHEAVAAAQASSVIARQQEEEA